MSEILIPYCESDFKVLREQGYIYVDKTEYLKKLEREKRALYVRPRRFGKTLFTSMLACYYDIAEKDNYDKLFKGLYIYDNPLETKNNYYILRFNFSGAGSDGNDKEQEAKTLFNDRVFRACERFISRYDLDINLESKGEAASSVLDELLSKFEGLKKENKIFVIIDEYDHFTNSMLNGDLSRLREVSKSGGYVRNFYEVLKDYCEANSVVERFFATGVAPLALDSLTSGFNIATNISLNQNFIAMCGLTENEVKELVKKAGLSDDVYEDLKRNYDGYRFGKTKVEHTFNVTLLMYYLKHYVENLKAPEDLIDQNLATSLSKIRALVELETPKENYAKLIELLTTGEVSGRLIERFEIDKEGYNVDSFLSLLFYQGYITIKDNDYGDVKFCVPNYVSEVLYADYFSKIVSEDKKYEMNTEDIRNAIKAFSRDGRIEDMTKVVSNFLKHQSIRDRENFNEKTLKYVYSLFFSLTNQFYVYGEFPALQGFADLFIEKTSSSYSKYEAVIELKYLNKENTKKVNMKKLKEEAISQMQGYIKDKRLGNREDLKKFVIIFEGFDKYNIFEIKE